MKKFVAILLLMLMLLLAGCSETIEASAERQNGARFTKVDAGNWCEIVVDNETGVMYVVSDCLYNTGTYTLLVDAEGHPLIWEGYKGSEKE